MDTHIRKNLDYDWMVQVHALAKDLYCKFNFGKNRELMIQICEDMDVRMKQLANFSTTRFANSIRNVSYKLNFFHFRQ